MTLRIKRPVFSTVLGDWAECTALVEPPGGSEENLHLVIWSQLAHNTANMCKLRLQEWRNILQLVLDFSSGKVEWRKKKRVEKSCFEYFSSVLIV